MIRKGLILSAAAVAVLGAGYAWLVSAKPFEKKDSSKVISESTMLVSADPSTISRISVRRPDGSSYTFLKVGEGYSLEGRPGVELMRSKIDSAFRSASSIVASGLIDKHPKKPEDFGFDRPGLVMVGIGGGPALGLEIGAASPGGDYYVRLPGTTPVHTVSSGTIDSFYGRLDDFRNRTLPAIDGKALKYLRIAKAATTIEIEDRPEGYDDFYMTSLFLLKPYRHIYPANLDSLDALVEAMPARFAIKDFVDDARPLAGYGLDPPILDITLRDETTTLRLLSGKSADATTVYAKLADKPDVFTIEKSAIDFAAKADPFGLAIHVPLLVPIDRVDKLSFRVKDRTFFCEIRKTELPPGRDAKQGDKIKYETTYIVNGKIVEGETFRKNIYQSVIGIALEGANPVRLDVRKLPIEAAVTFWQGGGRKPRSFNFVAANSDFYALSSEGDAEFLITKSQVDAVADRIEATLSVIK
jgi:hypothetical protein